MKRVQLRAVALTDQSAVAKPGRWIVGNGASDPSGDFWGTRQPARQVVQPLCACAFGCFRQIGHPQQRGFQGNQVASVSKSGGGAAHQPLHVAQPVQQIREVAASDQVADKRLDRLMPTGNASGVEERLLQPAPKQASAHGGPRGVQNAEERPLSPSFAERCRQLQMASRGAVEHHEIARGVGAERADMRQRIDLRLFEIAQHERACVQPCREFVAAEPAKRLGLKVVEEHVAALRRAPSSRANIPRRVRRDRGATCAPDRLDQLLSGVVGNQYLRGLEPHDLVQQLFDPTVAFDLRRQELTGRNIDDPDARDRIADHRRHQVVVALGVQHVVFEDSAGGNHASHLALDQALGVLGVLHLIHDRDAPSLADQPRNVALGSMVRNARHRDANTAVFAAGQRNVKIARDRLSIVAIRFKEIPDAHQQDDAGVLLARGEVLKHKGSIAAIPGRNGRGLGPAGRSGIGVGHSREVYWGGSVASRVRPAYAGN